MHGYRVKKLEKYVVKSNLIKQRQVELSLINNDNNND